MRCATRCPHIFFTSAYFSFECRLTVLPCWIRCFSLPLLCPHSGGCPSLLPDGTAHPKTETDTLSSHGRRRRQLKVEYDKDEGVTPVKTEHWEPPDWKKQLGYIREMRSGRDAPVDNMGAEKCYDPEAPARVRVVLVFFLSPPNFLVQMNSSCSLCCLLCRHR